MNREPIEDAVVLATLADVVARVAGSTRTPSSVGRDTPLAEGYWLDSVELLEVLIACEAAFGITFDERRDFGGDSLDTLGSLVDLVQAKRGQVETRP